MLIVISEITYVGTGDFTIMLIICGEITYRVKYACGYRGFHCEILASEIPCCKVKSRVAYVLCEKFPVYRRKEVKSRGCPRGVCATVNLNRTLSCHTYGGTHTVSHSISL